MAGRGRHRIAEGAMRDCGLERGRVSHQAAYAPSEGTPIEGNPNPATAVARALP
jgi:hypothetical protein